MRIIQTTLVLIFSLTILSNTQAQDKEWASSTVSIPVTNLDQSVKWYKKLLMIEEDISPAPGVTEFKINDKTWVQLFEVENFTTSQNIMRLEVSAIEKAHKRVSGLTKSIQKVEYIENVVYYFDFTDPDGNLLSFYQIPGS
ncbi:MAG: VOC family protein [Bacteroidota bacterium]